MSRKVDFTVDINENTLRLGGLGPLFSPRKKYTDFILEHNRKVSQKVDNSGVCAGFQYPDEKCGVEAREGLKFKYVTGLIARPILELSTMLQLQVRWC